MTPYLNSFERLEELTIADNFDQFHKLHTAVQLFKEQYENLVLRYQRQQIFQQLVDGAGGHMAG